MERAKLNNMQMHEILSIPGTHTTVLRVPGGFIYRFNDYVNVSNNKNSSIFKEPTSIITYLFIPIVGD